MKNKFLIIIIFLIIGLLCSIVYYKFIKKPVIDYNIVSISYVDYNPFDGDKEIIPLSKKDVKKLSPYLKKIYVVDKYSSERLKVQCMPLFGYSGYLIIDSGTNKNYFYYEGGCGSGITKEGKYNNRKVEFHKSIYNKIIGVVKKYKKSGEIDR